MKIYKVPLYKVSYFILSYGEVSYIEDIIVKKEVFGVKEILTGYSKIDVLNRSSLNEGLIDSFDRREDKYNSYGYHLVVFRDSFVPKNRVVEKELDNYINKYDESKWKKIYENMKIISKNENNKINNKVKNIFESKK